MTWQCFRVKVGGWAILQHHTKGVSGPLAQFLSVQSAKTFLSLFFVRKNVDGCDSVIL